MVSEREYEISNIGIMFEGRHPKISEHENKIKESLSTICQIDESKIGITATSGEYLTPWGKGEGIQAFSIVLLNKK